MGSAQPAGGEVIGVHAPGGRRAVEMFRSGSEALMADAADIFFGPSKWRQLQVPIRFLTAEWSTGARATADLIAEALS